MNNNSKTHDCVVIGAGAVGLACALSLQADGREVCIIERDGPGEGTSFGNAAYLAPEEYEPLASPATLSAALGYLLRADQPLSIRPGYLLPILPWLARFVWSSRPSSFRRGAAAMKSLAERAVAEHQALADLTGTSDLLIRNGGYMMMESEKGTVNYLRHAEMLREEGIAVQILNPEEARKPIPHLPDQALKVVHFPNSAHIADPREMCRRWAEYFEHQGGRMVAAEVSAIEKTKSGFLIGTDNTNIKCKTLVLAAGVWSKPLARMLGSNVPLDTERGYHLTVEQEKGYFPAPLFSLERRAIMTSLKTGLRITGFVEFGGLKLPPDPKKIEILKSHYRELVGPLDESKASTWMGFRPSLPDFLPIIAPAPNAPGAWLAFGHQHLGITLSAETGRIIGDMVAGRDPGVDMTPFRANRF